MHDIWNPWHGCVKKSEGCDNCYMYFLDRQRNADGRRIYKVKSNFDYPLQKDRSGRLSAAGLGRRLGKRFFQCYLRKSKAGGRANPDYVQTAF